MAFSRLSCLLGGLLVLAGVARARPLADPSLARRSETFEAKWTKVLKAGPSAVQLLKQLPSWVKDAPQAEDLVRLCRILEKAPEVLGMDEAQKLFWSRSLSRLAERQVEAARRRALLEAMPSQEPYARLEAVRVLPGERLRFEGLRATDEARALGELVAAIEVRQVMLDSNGFGNVSASGFTAHVRRTGYAHGVLDTLLPQGLWRLTQRSRGILHDEFALVSALDAAVLSDMDGFRIWGVSMDTNLRAPFPVHLLAKDGSWNTFSTDSSGLLSVPRFPVYADGLRRLIVAKGGDCASVNVHDLGPRQTSRSAVRIWTDRPAYAPGEMVHVRGIRAKLGRNGTFGPDLDRVHLLTIGGTTWGKAYRDVWVRPDSTGLFQDSVRLPADVRKSSWLIGVDDGTRLSELERPAVQFLVAPERAPSADSSLRKPRVRAKEIETAPKLDRFQTRTGDTVLLDLPGDTTDPLRLVVHRGLRIGCVKLTRSRHETIPVLPGLGPWSEVVVLKATGSGIRQIAKKEMGREQGWYGSLMQVDSSKRLVARLPPNRHWKRGDTAELSFVVTDHAGDPVSMTFDASLVDAQTWELAEDSADAPKPLSLGSVHTGLGWIDAEIGTGRPADFDIREPGASARRSDAVEGSWPRGREPHARGGAAWFLPRWRTKYDNSTAVSRMANLMVTPYVDNPSATCILAPETLSQDELERCGYKRVYSERRPWRRPLLWKVAKTDARGVATLRVAVPDYPARWELRLRGMDKARLLDVQEIFTTW